MGVPGTGVGDGGFDNREHFFVGCVPVSRSALSVAWGERTVVLMVRSTGATVFNRFIGGRGSR